MSSRAAAFERGWSLLAAGSPIREVEGRRPTVVLELRLAQAVATLAGIQPEPEWEDVQDGIGPRISVAGGRIVYPSQGGVRTRRRRHLAPALVAAVVSAILLLGALAAGAAPGSILYPARRSMERVALLALPNDRAVWLRIAEARLADLLRALDGSHLDLAPGLARDLIDARTEVIRSGVPTDQLDGKIAVQVPAALVDAPQPVAQAIRSILGSLLPQSTELSALSTQPPALDGFSTPGHVDAVGTSDGSSSGGTGPAPNKEGPGELGDRTGKGESQDEADGESGGGEAESGGDEPSGGDEAPDQEHDSGDRDREGDGHDRDQDHDERRDRDGDGRDKGGE